MHVTYIPCHTKAELCDKMKKLSEAPEGEAPSFLEATVYSKETSVIMIGEFDDCDTPEKKRKVNRINDWWQPWYYTHVEKALTNGGFDEFIPVRHYHHRFTRSIFWELRGTMDALMVCMVSFSTDRPTHPSSKTILLVRGPHRPHPVREPPAVPLPARLARGA